MSWNMSDWEVRRIRDHKLQSAIREAQQDRLAQGSQPTDGRRRVRWVASLLVASLVAIGFWLMHK